MAAMMTDVITDEASRSTVRLSARHARSKMMLWASIPAIRYDIGLSSRERRACLVASIRVASYRRARTRRRSIIRSITHAPDQTVARPRFAPWLISTPPHPARPFCPTDDFHALSRASGPSCNQLRIPSLTPSQLSSSSDSRYAFHLIGVSRLSPTGPTVMGLSKRGGSDLHATARRGTTESWTTIRLAGGFTVYIAVPARAARALY